jgi:uncharacterized membrane protein
MPDVTSQPLTPHTSHPTGHAALPLVRLLAVASLVGLILLGLAWELWLAPLRPGGSWWAIKVLPLCLPLAGLLRNRLYTYRWLSLMLWLYFLEGAVRATSDRAPSSYYAALQVLLCLLLFAACLWHVKLRFKNKNNQLPA